MYCIRAYRIHAPSAPTTLAIVPHAYPLICSPHQHCSYHKSTLKFLPTTIPVYHVFRSMQHQFMFKWTPSPSLPHVVHLVTLFSSQIRGCIGIWVSHPSCDVCLYTILICTRLLTGSIILSPRILIHTAITNGSWNFWKETIQFIVDSYHYINHCASDYFCCKWRNPAPLNGSAPNLVVVEHDVKGNAHYKHTFNTQICLVIRFELTLC